MAKIEIDTVMLTEQQALEQSNYNSVKIITMRQARLALLSNNLLHVVDNAIITGTDEAMKIEWEYATEVRRDWVSLINMATALNITTTELDALFELGATL